MVVRRMKKKKKKRKISRWREVERP